MPPTNVARRGSGAVATPAARSTNGTQQVQYTPGRYGPYIRIDRANEVAAYFRSLNYNARVVYLGTLDDRTYAVQLD